MTSLFARVAPDEIERLAECVLEPIRHAGAVQPHGLLLAVNPEDLTITHVSDNAERLIGVDPVAVLGRALSDLLDSAGLASIRAVLSDDDGRVNPSTAVVADQVFDVISQRHESGIFVEFEPRAGEDVAAIMSTRDVMRHMVTATSVTDLWAKTAAGVRTITGFDRVMIYHFYPDSHGQIVGEARADDIEPYLGLHYPASDIPEQARQLYLTKRSRLIVNSGVEHAALLSDANQQEARDVDLGVAELRAVSPHHLQFMRNIGQVSTFSLSVVRDGILVGMITCAHRSERRLSYNLRDGLELLANQLSLQLGAMFEIDRLERRDAVSQVRAGLMAQVAGTDDMVDALLFGPLTLLDLVQADGVALRINGRLASLGMVPPTGALNQLPLLVAEEGGSVDFTSDSVPADYPDLARNLPDVAGILVRPLGTDGDYIAWFRKELEQSIDWLGDMTAGNRDTPLSPRNSFRSWREEVRGTSAAWTGVESQPRELIRDLHSALLHQARLELASLALLDGLTGLSNRRAVMATLEKRLASDRSPNTLALLFIDLDKFKCINDTYGHTAGDAALIHVGNSLRSAARAGDIVARLGGDEFVIVVEDVDKEQAQQIAARIVDAVASTPADGSPWRVTASVGIALGAAEFDASQLLRAADDAMYRAKRAGRNRVSG